MEKEFELGGTEETIEAFDEEDKDTPLLLLLLCKEVDSNDGEEGKEGRGCESVAAT